MPMPRPTSSDRSMPNGNPAPTGIGLQPSFGSPVLSRRGPFLQRAVISPAQAEKDPAAQDRVPGGPGALGRCKYLGGMDTLKDRRGALDRFGDRNRAPRALRAAPCVSEKACRHHRLRARKSGRPRPELRGEAADHGGRALTQPRRKPGPASATRWWASQRRQADRVYYLTMTGGAPLTTLGGARRAGSLPRRRRSVGNI